MRTTIGFALLVLATCFMLVGCNAIFGLEPGQLAPQADAASTSGGGGAGGDGGGPGGSDGGGGSDPCGASCYEADEATLRHGACRAGTYDCASDACVDQVLPAPETCWSSDDEDCDGRECARWSALVAGPGVQNVVAVSSTPDGSLVVVGAFNGAADFGDGDVVIADSDSWAFVVAMDGEGTLLWKHVIASPVEARATAVNMNVDDEVIAIAGQFRETADTGAGALTANGLRDAFVLTLLPDGTPLAVTNFGAADAEVLPVAIGYAPQVPQYSIVGTYWGSLGSISSVGSSDGFVVTLDPADLSPQYSAGFGTASNDAVRSAHYDSTEHRWAIGGALGVGEASFYTIGGSEPLFVSEGPFPSGFLLGLNPEDFAISYANTVGGGSGDAAVTTVHQAAGNVVIAGYHKGPLDLGGGELPAAGANNVFVAKLLAASAGHIWSESFAGALWEEPTSLLVQSDGSFVIAGFFEGAIGFGPQTLQSQGGLDIFVVKFLDGGEHAWSRQFGGTGTQRALGVSGLLDDVVVVGNATDHLDVGAGTSRADSSSDGWVARFAP